MGNADARVEGGDIANASLGHVAVAFFHFDDNPAEGEENFFGFGHDGDDEMGKAIVNLEFDDFGIDQDETEIVWAEAVEQAEKQSIDTDRFARTGGAGDKGVRKIGQVVDESGPIDVFAEGNGKVSGGGVPLRTFDQVTEENFDFGGVGDLDGDGVAAGNRSEDVNAFGFHGAGKIAFEVADPFHANARGGVKFVASDGGSPGDVAGADLDIEVGQSFDNALLVGFEFVFRKGGANIFFGFLEKIDGGKFVFVVGRASGSRDGGGGGLGGGFGFGGGFGRGKRIDRSTEFFDFGGGGICFGRFFRFGFGGGGEGGGKRSDGGIEDFGCGARRGGGEGGRRGEGGGFFFGEASAEASLLNL